ncbi:hypothetical protein [Bradyrhizobium ganzhouense]|uniref:hypothetical protein n=1 Tax=Bradyrhizobium ganzhouense TaxID=1179767 RepID=UPI003CEE66E4
MLANSRLSGRAVCITLARMRTHTTINGSELLLGVIAIRLAVLVLVGWGLTLLPRQAQDSEPTCLPSSAATIEARSPANPAGTRIVDAALDDLRLHD